MKILLVGSTGPGALERYCIRALQALGHHVDVLDRGAEITGRSRFNQVSLLCEVEQVPLHLRFNRLLLRAVQEHQPDLLFVIKGVEVYSTTLERIRALPRPPLLINWNPDSPFDHGTANTNRALRASIPLYDIYFIWDHDLFSPLRRRGARHIAYLPFAYDPEAHASPAPGQPASEICFIGGFTPARADLLRSLTAHDLHIYGTGWERLPTNDRLRGCLRGGYKAEAEMAGVFAAAGIVLNFIRPQNGQAHNMRTFEAPASGGFMLSTRTRDQQMLLPDGVAAAYFATPQEMRSQVAYYLAQADRRAAIAAEGHRRITQGRHTYLERMKAVIAAVEAL